MKVQTVNPYQPPEVLSYSPGHLVRAAKPGVAFFLSIICGSVLSFAAPVTFLLAAGELPLLKAILAMFTDLSSDFYRLTWAWVLVPGLLMGFNSSQIAQGHSAKHAAATSGFLLTAFVITYALILGPRESWLYRCAIAVATVQILVAVTIGKACRASTHKGS